MAKNRDDALAVSMLKAIKNVRDFPLNTCPASRHVELAARSLIEHRDYAMFEEEPAVIAGSMLSAASSLYEARTILNILRPPECDIDAGAWWWKTTAGKAFLRQKKAGDK